MHGDELLPHAAMHAGKDANKTRASFFSIAGALESGKARHEK